MSYYSFKKLLNSLAFLSFLSLAALFTSTVFGGLISVSSGTITNGTTSLVAVSGTSPNGTTWASFVTGTNPVAYFDLSTGSLMFDPKGRGVNLVDFKYGTAGTVSGTTPGPLVFATGTGNPGSVSTSSIERTWPVGTWSAISTFQARLSGNISLTNTPTLTTSGGNIASTDGSFNQPWSFGALAPSLINQQATLYSSTSGQGFRSNAAGGDLLGYGSGIGMFAWSPFGGGSFYSAVVPVSPVTAVPEPSTFVLAGLGVAAMGASRLRRRRRSGTRARAVPTA